MATPDASAGGSAGASAGTSAGQPVTVPPHVHYAPPHGPPEMDAADAAAAAAAYGPSPAQQGRSFSAPAMDPYSGGGVSPLRPGSSSIPGVPGLRRRPARAFTVRNVDNFVDFDMRPGWAPGAEPGIDTSKPDGGRATLARMMAPSEITVVDFGQSDMTTTRLDNATLAGFLALPRKAQCRWINVNGLSWDVIQVLGNHKNLHRLAIEDLLNIRNRTKVDWYLTHAFMVLTLQKLVHFDEYPRDGDNDSHSDSDNGGEPFWKDFAQRLKRFVLGDEALSPYGPEAGSLPSKAQEHGVPSGSMLEPQSMEEINAFRTIQRYHASPNDMRTSFMENNSALSSRNLAVAAEQVSIFLTNDNTVISFFERSAQDVEQPILRRLRLPDTSLRRSCDASMVAQAILDAIIDLAIPVTGCYGDVIADLEMDVLTRPSVEHTKSLYITITEMNKVLSFINPVTNLINTLRDHKTDSAAIDDLQDPEKGIIVSPMTYIYLADVLDHCVLITESLELIRGQAENMISLIFNTISAYQNESMKQLTIVTIIFLPLTFLTGYFGQNFDNFSDLQRGIPFFWQIAGPVIFFTIVILMRDMIVGYIRTFIQRRHITTLRKHRRKRREGKKKQG